MPEYVKVARLAVPVGLASDRRQRPFPRRQAHRRRPHPHRWSSPPRLSSAPRAGSRCRRRQRVRPLGASRCNPASALRAHRELGRALTSYLAADSGPPGDPASWQPRSGDPLRPGRDCCCHRSRFEVALTAELQVATAAGPKQVCIEPGWRFDERNAFVDPADPRDTPLGHHAVAEILARDGRIKLALARRIDRLIDPRACPVSWPHVSPTRRVVRWLWWLLVPIAAALALAAPDYWLFGVPRKLEPFSSRLSAWGSRSWSR